MALVGWQRPASLTPLPLTVSGAPSDLRQLVLQQTDRRGNDHDRNHGEHHGQFRHDVDLRWSTVRHNGLDSFLQVCPGHPGHAHHWTLHVALADL